MLSTQKSFLPEAVDSRERICPFHRTNFRQGTTLERLAERGDSNPYVTAVTWPRDQSHRLLQSERRYWLCEASQEEAFMVDSKSVRRSLIFGLALSLAGLGTGSLSACALLTSQLAECATPQTRSQCDQMNMDESGTQLVAAPDTSCCLVSKAPIPQLQSKAADLSLAAPDSVLDPAGDTLRIQRLLPVLIVQELSPPSVQSLLCTFLI